MSIKDDFRRTKLAVQYRGIDAAIGIKERLPLVSMDSLSNRFGYALLFPAVVLVSCLAVGMGMLAWYSFLTFDPIEVLVYDYTLQNWMRLLDNPAYHRVFYRTILYSAVVTVACVTFGVPYAYLIIRTESRLFRNSLLVGLFIPFFSGVIIRVYGWLILLGENGVVNWLLVAAGFGRISFIGTPKAVILGLFQYMLPMAVLMLTPAIAAIDRDLERAARNCGASQWETFRHIVLPLAKPGIASASIIVLTLSMATYSIPDLLGGGTLSFVANFIYTSVFTSLNYPFAAVLSGTLVIIASLVVVVIFRVYGTGTLGAEVDGE